MEEFGGCDFDLMQTELSIILLKIYLYIGDLSALRLQIIFVFLV